MAKRRKRRMDVRRHPLLIYKRMGRRLRMLPLMISLFGLILVAFGWLGSQGLLPAGNQVLITRIQEQRLLLLFMVGVSAVFYLLLLGIGVLSYVEARDKTLRVRAGMITVDISYSRIKQLRLVQFAMQYPFDKLGGSERNLARPYFGSTATALDLKSLPWPFTNRMLRLLWHKFMFTRDGGGLMFLVPDPMVLNQQIDAKLAHKRVRKDLYDDPIERAFRQHERNKGQGLGDRPR